MNESKDPAKVDIETTPDSEVEQPEPEVSEAEAAPELTAEEELAEQNDRYLRLAAEFDNFRKRTAREWQDRVRATNAELLYDLLDIVDNFERALAVEHEDSAYADGVRMILQQFQAQLEKWGVRAMPALGETFDPSRHEALLHVASPDYDEGHVCQEIRRGYMLHDRVLRAAQVAVSKGAEETGEANSASEDDEAQGESHG
jgi:molecular chaperone GrpE